MLGNNVNFFLFFRFSTLHWFVAFWFLPAPDRIFFFRPVTFNNRCTKKRKKKEICKPISYYLDAGELTPGRLSPFLCCRGNRFSIFSCVCAFRFYRPVLPVWRKPRVFWAPMRTRPPASWFSVREMASFAWPLATLRCGGVAWPGRLGRVWFVHWRSLSRFDGERSWQRRKDMAHGVAVDVSLRAGWRHDTLFFFSFLRSIRRKKK